jgi:hypothetical protein
METSSNNKIDIFTNQIQIFVRKACETAKIDEDDMWKIMREHSKIIGKNYKYFHQTLSEV